MKLIDAIKAGDVNALVSALTPGFKYKPKKGMFEASNNALRLDDLTAWSYSHWCYFRIIDGKGVFNDYRYSVTTSKHQSNMRWLLGKLGIDIVLNVKTRTSLSKLDMGGVRECLLKEYYATKAQLSKCRRESKKRNCLQWRLETLAGDVELIDGAPFDGGRKQVKVMQRDATAWGSSDMGIHRLDPSESDMRDAFEQADRDGFDTIYVYRTKTARGLKLVRA